MKKETIAITSGRDHKKQTGTVNVPIHRTSTVLFPTWQAYENAEKGKDFYDNSCGSKNSDLSYGIAGTPTTFAAQKTLAAIDNADNALLYPSGLNAITTTLLSLLRIGDHLLMVDTVYGPTRRFCNKTLAKLGIETTYYDPLIGEEIADLIKDNTKVIFTETPGSLTFEVQDIPAVRAAVGDRDIAIIVDNSWATPIFYQPFDKGVDIAIQAGTKYIGGHSDLFLGVATFNDKFSKKMTSGYKNFGVCVSPDACYDAARGVRTMPTRLKAHEKSALSIAKWLQGNAKVAKVFHPALESCPGHEIWKRDFSGSTGLFAVVLEKKYSKSDISNFIDNMDLFGIGASWGGFESLVITFDPSSIRTATKWQDEGTCIRFYIGLEDEEDLRADIESAFARLP